MLVDSNVGIKNIKKFQASLMEELETEEKEIVLDFSDVKRVDLSVVQLIISAGRTARKSGKNIKLKYVSDEVKLQMHLCGLKT